MAKRDATGGPTFVYAPGLPMTTRLWLMGVVVIAGVDVQSAASVFLGLLIVIAGSSLGAMRSRGVKPPSGKTKQWESTTIDELGAVIATSERVESCRSRIGVFSTWSGPGCGLTVVSLICIAIGTKCIAQCIDKAAVSDLIGQAFVPPTKGGPLSPLFAMDAIAMLIPTWLAGAFTVWEPPELRRKVEYMLAIRKAFASDADLEFLPSLYTSVEGDRSVPLDCRLLVRLRSAPKEFLGIQIQISLNDVQGTKYPYCYCVLIADKGFDLPEKARAHMDQQDTGGWTALKLAFSDTNTKREAKFSRFDGSIAELTGESDKDVVVVRQVTSGTGYNTSVPEACEVFRDALKLARLVLQQGDK